MKLFWLLIPVFTIVSCSGTHTELPQDSMKGRDSTIQLLVKKIPYRAFDEYVDSFKILAIDTIAGNWHFSRDARILEWSIKYLKDTLAHNTEGYILERAKTNLRRTQQALAELHTVIEKNNDTSFYGYIVTVRYHLYYSEGNTRAIEIDSVIIPKTMKNAETLTSFSDRVRHNVWQ